MNKLLANAFLPISTVKKEISFIDLKTGETHTADVYVKPLSYASAVQDILSAGANADQAIARRIAYSIRNDKGEPIFTEGQITGADNPAGALSPTLTVELLRVIGEVSSLGKTKT